MKLKTAQTSVLLVLVMLNFSSASASFFSFGKRYNRSMITAKSKVKEPKATKIEEQPVAQKLTLEDIYQTEEVKSVEPIEINSTEIVYTQPVAEINIISNVEKPENKPSKINISETKTQVLTPGNFTIVKPTKAELKQIKQALKNAPADGQRILEIILAIFLPPVAVLVHENDINVKFLISILLTLLFWIPGVIYALLVVFDKL